MPSPVFVLFAHCAFQGSLHPAGAGERLNLKSEYLRELSIEFWQINRCVDSVHFALPCTLSVHLGNNPENGHFTHKSIFNRYFSVTYISDVNYNHLLKCSRRQKMIRPKWLKHKKTKGKKQGINYLEKHLFFDHENDCFLGRKMRFQKPY